MTHSLTENKKSLYQIKRICNDGSHTDAFFCRDAIFVAATYSPSLTVKTTERMSDKRQ